MELSVVIPAYNEAGNIKPLLAEIRKILDGYCLYEVICIDDFSTDDTARELIAAKDDGFLQLRIFRHTRNYGQSAGLLTGIRAARAPWVATLDGDGQNDPGDIPRMLSRIRISNRQPCLQLVVGCRTRRRDTHLKRLSSRIANGARRWVLKDDTSDTGCGIKIVSREAFLALPYFDHMHRFLPALFQGYGGLVETVEVNHRLRQHGTSHYGVFDRLWIGIVDLFGVWWLLKRHRRVEFAEMHDEQH
ncbi:MAG: glycosyltransferase family 2 protein [Gammaproteobacteria bacterium]|nr:glycosyltransferase family 2 protein [Gammaproteobacteria bacterium]